MAEQTGAFVE